MILKFSRQKVKTQVRLLLEEQSDQGLHFLLFHLHLFDKLKQCFLRKTMSPNHLPLSATLKIMVLSYGDHLSNNILWAEMVRGRNGYGPKWSWNDPK